MMFFMKEDPGKGILEDRLRRAAGNAKAMISIPRGSATPVASPGFPFRGNHYVKVFTGCSSKACLSLR